jgi:DNA-directed RNA polymerase specialized sigma24 family protein
LVEKARLARIVRDIVERLPSDEREFVDRYYFRGESIRDAAAAIGRDKYWGIRANARVMEKIEGELRERDVDTERFKDG